MSYSKDHYEIPVMRDRFIKPDATELRSSMKFDHDQNKWITYYMVALGKTAYRNHIATNSKYYYFNDQLMTSAEFDRLWNLRAFW